MQLRSVLLATSTAGLLAASVALAQTTGSSGGTGNTSGPSSGATTGGASGGTMGSSTGGTPGLPGSTTAAPSHGQQTGRSTPACPEGSTASGRRMDDGAAGCIDTGPGAAGARR